MDKIKQEKRVILQHENITDDVIITEDNVIIQNCKITGNVILDGTTNSLVAKCDVAGNILVKNSLNCVVLLNNAVDICATQSKNIYVIQNSIKNVLSLYDNSYLLADENTCHDLLCKNCDNINGDNITDIDSRLDCGADERLLPHPNKELFVGAHKNEYVTAPDSLECEHLHEYIKRCAVGGKTVIIPPGAYLSPEPITLDATASGSKIYAYGVLQHMIPYGRHLNIENTHDIEIRGLTTSYDKQICGQVTVADEIDDRTLIVIPYAGSNGGFGKSDPDLFNLNATDVFEKGMDYPWDLLLDQYDIVPCGDRRYKLTMHDHSHSRGNIHKGDRITCRLSGPNKSAIMIASSKNILFKDTTLYCHSACLAVVAHGISEGIRFCRWYDGREAARIIDKETYDFYRAIEEEYEIDGQVYIDDKGRYRSQAPLTCSADGLHIIGTNQGISLTSCTFDGLCDDGSNQHATSSRLAGIEDNGDGTSTLYYKGNVSRVYCIKHFKEQNGYGSPGHCYEFTKGDRLLAYNAQGVTLCDTMCLSDSEDVEIYTFTLTPEECPPRHYRDMLRKVTVKTSDLNMNAIYGYDLSDNNFVSDNKVTVDNLSRNAANYTIDNVAITNGRSRGVLVKTVGATIRNCTINNMAHAGVLLSAEIAWGESSVAQETVIEKCLFDHVGYIEHCYYVKKNAPIAIVGLSSEVSEDSLLYKNIIIRDNRFKNIFHDHIITINSAQDVKILNNIFEESPNENIDSPKKIIDIDTSMNIELSGNTYSKNLKNVSDGISARNFKNIYGDDVTIHGDID